MIDNCGCTRGQATYQSLSYAQAQIPSPGICCDFMVIRQSLTVFKYTCIWVALSELEPLGGASAASYHTTQEISYKTPSPRSPNIYNAQLSVLFHSCGFERPNE